MKTRSSENVPPATHLIPLLWHSDHRSCPWGMRWALGRMCRCSLSAPPVSADSRLLGAESPQQVESERGHQHFALSPVTVTLEHRWLPCLDKAWGLQQ